MGMAGERAIPKRRISREVAAEGEQADMGGGEELAQSFGLGYLLWGKHATVLFWRPGEERVIPHRSGFDQVFRNCPTQVFQHLLGGTLLE